MNNAKRSKAFKKIVDDFYNGNYTVTAGNNDFDVSNHIYDVKTIMCMTVWD